MSRTAPQSTITPWRHRWRQGARIAFLLLAAAIAGQAAAAGFTARLLGKWPGRLHGEVLSIAVDQGFAYIGLHGPGFLILDVRNPAAPEFVSDLDLGGWTAGLAISGTTVYLSNGELGLQVIDVADRARPRLAATLRTAPANRPFENFPHAGSNVAVSGHHVFLADGKQGLKGFDVSDPTEPKLLGRLTVPNTEGVEAVAVSVAGDRAYLACGYGGLWVVDIGNPAAPRRIATFPPSEQGLPVVHVAVSGTVAYFTDWRNLVALDVSDPGNPRRLSAIFDDFAAHMTLSGATAFVRSYDGVHLVDVANPSRPKLQGMLEGIRGNLVVDAGLVFGDDGTGLAIFDVSTPEQPRRVGGIVTRGGVSQVLATGEHAYVIGGTDGLKVLNVQDPGRPERVGPAGELGGHVTDVAMAKNHVYLSEPENGILVCDVSRPEQPRQVGLVPKLAENWTSQIATSDHALYTLESLGPQHDRMRLSVLTLDDPARPQAAGALLFERGARFWVMRAGRNHVCLAGYAANFVHALRVVDVTDPSRPTLVYNAPLGVRFTDVAIAGNHAFATADGVGSEDGLWILDLSHTPRPELVGRLRMPIRMERVGVSGNHAYVATETGILHLIDVSDPTRPRPLGQTQIAASWERMVINGGRIYVPTRFRGMFIYSDPLAMIFSKPPTWETGGVRMTLQGPPGGAFEIQRTGDFQSWATWIEGVFGDTDTGGLEFFDETAGSNPFQFYRARQR